MDPVFIEALNIDVAKTAIKKEDITEEDPLSGTNNPLEDYGPPVKKGKK